MTNNLQGTIEQIRKVIAAIGPATARQIETHPDVVKACRSSKAKARRLIERLQVQGHIQSSGDAQQPRFWVQDTDHPQGEPWVYDENHNRRTPLITKCKTNPMPLYTTRELADEFGVTPAYLLTLLKRDPSAPQKVNLGFTLSWLKNNYNYYRGKDIRRWWANRKNTRRQPANDPAKAGQGQ
jgi:hypothetical protein